MPRCSVPDGDGSLMLVGPFRMTRYGKCLGREAEMKTLANKPPQPTSSAAGAFRLLTVDRRLSTIDHLRR